MERTTFQGGDMSRPRYEEKIFWVDIPDSNNVATNDDQPFINVGTFKTRKEAVEFAQKQFGADKDGNINLITEG